MRTSNQNRTRSLVVPTNSKTNELTGTQDLGEKGQRAGVGGIRGSGGDEGGGEGNEGAKETECVWANMEEGSLGNRELGRRQRARWWDGMWERTALTEVGSHVWLRMDMEQRGSWDCV